MWRKFLVAAVVLGVSPGGRRRTRTNPPSAAAKSAAEKLRDNPNDAQALNSLAGERLREIAGLMEDKPDEALAKLNEFDAVVSRLRPDAAAAKSLVSDIRSEIDSIASRSTPPARRSATWKRSSSRAPTTSRAAALPHESADATSGDGAAASRSERPKRWRPTAPR